MTRIHIQYSSSPARKKPRAGDRRTTKKHGLQIRVQTIIKPSPGLPGGWLYSNGRPVYEWAKPEDLLGGFWDYLLTPEERAAAELQQAMDRAAAAPLPGITKEGA